MKHGSENTENITLSRALTLLELLARSSEVPQTLTQLAESSKIPKATVHRLLGTLVERGYASRSLEGGFGYQLGLRCQELGSLTVAFRGVRAAAKQEMDRINQTSGELIVLAVYDDGYAVYVDTRQSTNPVCCASNVGFRAPATCIATGRALLAFRSEDDISHVLSWPIPQYSPRTIVTESELRRLLADVRKEGIATNFGCYRDGVGGVAAPIRNYAGEVVASVGLSLPEYRMDSSRLHGLKVTITEAANQISLNLGFPANAASVPADAGHGHWAATTFGTSTSSVGGVQAAPVA